MMHRAHKRSGTAWVAILLTLLMAGTALAQGPLPERANVKSPYATVAVAYAEDFEIDDGGFTAGGNETWEHGEPSVHVTPVSGQGPNMWGTNLDGNYEDRRCGWTESPPIDLSAYPPGAGNPASTARLLFRHWMHFESQWDGGVLQASADGVDWQVVQPAGGYTDRIISSTVRTCLGVEQGEPVFTGPSGTQLPPGDVWRSDEFDLSAYLGGVVHLRWVMATDTSQVRLGWYIDDVRIEVGAGVRASVDVPQPPNPQQGIPFTPLVTTYAEDFEFDDGGWTANGTETWEWGDAVAPPLPTEGGFSMWGTDLSGDYGTEECATLTSPPIDLPGAYADGEAEAARLGFSLWRETRSGYDGAVLQVSTDGGATWDRLVPHDGYDRTIFSSTAQTVRECLGVGTAEPVWSGPFSTPKDDDWIPVTADLTPYLGHSIRLRVVFASTDVAAERRGVYLDDVVVQLGAAAAVDLTDPKERLVFTQPGWTVMGDADWGWGVPTTGPVTTRPVWATDLHGDYEGNACGAVVSPPIDTALIPGLGKLTLHFDHYFDSINNYDGGVVQVSTDGGATWSVVRPDSGYTGTVYTPARTCLGNSEAFVGNPTGHGYVPETVDLKGKDSSELRVRFVFASNGFTHDLGWYVRNIGLSRGAAALPLSSGEPSDGLPIEAWEAIADVADDRLLGALKSAPWDEQPAVLLGPELPRVHAADIPTRQDAMSHLQARAEPFFLDVEQAIALQGGTLTHRHAAGPAVSVTGNALLLAQLALNTGARSATLDDGEAVHLVEPLPSDPVSIQNTGGRRMIQAEDIWALGYRGAGIRISVIDTGIDDRHEAFRHANGTSRVVNFTDYVQGRSAPYDDHGHGTHVAGTAAGSSQFEDPTYGVFEETGVAPEAEILGAKFLSSGGSGSLTNGILSLQWSFDEGADLTSNSWGSSSCSGGATIIEVVHDLTDLGMLSVFAAGNSGPGWGTVGSPACGESALSVGAVDEDQNVAWFSSRGPCSDPHLGTPPRICPDVVAKGVNVRSAIPRDGASQADPSGYKTWQGTSMATPHVAGAVALAEQMKRDLTGTGWDTAARAEEEVLKLTALDLGAEGPDNDYGWGLVQLLNVHALLDSTDEARVIDSFGVSRSILHQGDSTHLSFSVRNLGGAVANGTFQTSLLGPDGTETVLAQREISLGLLDQEMFTDRFTVKSNVLHGTYTFQARFAYTWTNSTSGETHAELIERASAFEVRRVFFDMAIDGFAPSALPAVVQDVAVWATNLGNENATDVTFEFTVPDGYLFVPGANHDPTDPRTRYADPAPDRVQEDRTFGRVTLVWTRDAVDVEDTFSFTTHLVPSELGRQRALLVAKYHDGAGNPFSQGHAVTQEVTPLP